MAWITPLLISKLPLSCPRESAGIIGPCVTTVIMITTILISANVLALASWRPLAVFRLYDDKNSYHGNVPIEGKWIRNS